MGTVLVTGGRGYLGGHLVSRLLERGEEVRVFARRPIGGEAPGGAETSSPGRAPASPSVPTVWGDIRDGSAVRKAVSGAEVVIHLVSNFRSAGSDRKEAHEINVGGTENVLAAAEEEGVRQFIHCSTIGVHGDVREILAHEESPFNPCDIYQETKLLGEMKVWDHHRRSGLPVTVIRPISLFGPGDRRMLKLFKMIAAGWFVRAGSGEVYFQPAYVDDVVKGFVLGLRNEDAVGEAFIVGGDEYVTLNELAAVIAEELGVRSRTVSVPMGPVLAAATLCEWICAPFGVDPPLHRRRVSFYQNNRAFSIDKARRILGFEPEVSLREGIRRTADWYRREGWL